MSSVIYDKVALHIRTETVLASVDARRTGGCDRSVKACKGYITVNSAKQLVNTHSPNQCIVKMLPIRLMCVPLMDANPNHDFTPDWVEPLLTLGTTKDAESVYCYPMLPAKFDPDVCRRSGSALNAVLTALAPNMKKPITLHVCFLHFDDPKSTRAVQRKNMS